MRKLILLFIAAPLLVSCANLKVTRNDSPSGGDSVEAEMVYLAWGFAPIKKAPAAETVCPKGRFDSVTFGRTTGDAALTWLTLGFYVPHRAVFVCGK